MNQEIAAIPTRDRIIAAADELYNQAGREKFPSVDAVRRASKADMNSVSLIMKEWRHAQTTQAAPVRAISVPDAVHSAFTSAVAALWIQATDLANQSLIAAQAGWDAERAELDDMRADLAAACDTQAAELEAAAAALATAQAQATEQAAQAAQVRESITSELNAERVAAQTYKAQSEAAAAALAAAQAQATEQVAQAAQVRESITSELNAERVAAQTYKAQSEAAAAALAAAQAQAAAAIEQAAKAREVAAELRGQINAENKSTGKKPAKSE